MWEGKPCLDIYPDETFKDGITNGAEWYVVSGGMQDWNYLNTNCFEVTLELGCVKFPKTEKLPAYWKNNKNALLAFMNQVLFNLYCFSRLVQKIVVSSKNVFLNLGPYWS